MMPQLILRCVNRLAVNIMAFYSSTLFVEANASQRKALLISWGFGLINFA